MLGCTGQYRAETAYPWYEGQGSNLENCGPATAAMAVKWAGGQSGVAYAKAVTRKSGWWLYEDIAQHLSQQGLPNELVPATSVYRILSKNQSVITRIKVVGVPHYVFISDYSRGKALLADPLQGNKRIPISAIRAMMTDDTILAIRSESVFPAAHLRQEPKLLKTAFTP